MVLTISKTGVPGHNFTSLRITHGYVGQYIEPIQLVWHSIQVTYLKLGMPELTAFCSMRIAVVWPFAAHTSMSNNTHAGCRRAPRGLAPAERAASTITADHYCRPLRRPLLWTIAIDHYCRPLLQTIAVDHYYRPLLQTIAIDHCCRPLLQTITVDHCCRLLL